MALLLGALAPGSALASEPRVLVAFVPPAAGQDGLGTLGAQPSLSVGVASATQSSYTPAQALIDLSAGSRTSPRAYATRETPPIALRGRRIAGWEAVVARAGSAPADVVPGLLASSIPGGAAFVGQGREAAAFADRGGRLAEVRRPASAGIPAAARALLRRYELVGVRLAEPSQLDELVAALRPEDLLVALEVPPGGDDPQLLALGLTSGGEPRAVTSGSTRLPGIVSLTDVAPTILEHLGRDVPDDMDGRPIRAEGERDLQGLRERVERFADLPGRILPLLELLGAAVGLVLLVLAAAGGRPAVRAGLRAGGLGFLWVPTLLLVTGVLAPSAPVEIGGVIVAALVAGWASDFLVAWPRAAAIPCLTGVALHAIDLLGGSDLIVRSALGPNPRSGARFYGLGNELEIVLTLLLLVGLAAVLPGRTRSTRGAATVGAAGVAFGLLVTLGWLGADVGGVFTVGAGFAVAVLVLRPGGPTRRAVGVAVLVPLAGLVVLALADVVTGGEGHFTRTILRADAAGDIGDAITRRTSLAAQNLTEGLAPLTTLAAVALAVYGVRERDRLYSAVRGDAPWAAALAGSLAAAVAGALTNDSGPLLLVFGVFGLAAVTAYLAAAPGRAARAEASSGSQPAAAPGEPPRG